MNEKMFCYQCQETAGCKGCTMVGVCGKQPDVAAMQDLLVYVSKGLSAVTTALRREGQTIPAGINHLITLNLFTTITNANFDRESIEARIRATLEARQEQLARLNRRDGLPEAALWDGSGDWEEKARTVGVLSTRDEDIRSLRELITYGLKGLSAYSKHANVLLQDDPEVDAFLQRALAATLDDSLTVPMLRLPETIPLQEWTRKLYIKTNAIGWAMFISNVAVEIDITPHLSFQLPIYYSAVDYFSRELKFRTFAVQPELRWWFSKPDGLFVGAHFGTAYFNYATKGDWRIQTYDGDRPLWGGGLAAGYRMPLSKRHPRWNVEFSIGAGVYDVYYDKFYNEKNGPKATNGHTTFVGIDHAAVSFSYSFDLKKRRAER